MKRKDALIRPIGIGQKLAQRVGIFERAGIQGLESVSFIDGADRGQDLPLGAEVASPTVNEASRAAGFGADGRVGHGPALSRCGGGAQDVD